MCYPPLTVVAVSSQQHGPKDTGNYPTATSHRTAGRKPAVITTLRAASAETFPRDDRRTGALDAAETATPGRVLTFPTRN